MGENDETEIDSLRARYAAALHGVQAGVAIMAQREPNGESSPKHLRVGVNSAMCDTGALVKLLIAKGIFTEIEWWRALVEITEAERASYEARISANGVSVKLY